MLWHKQIVWLTGIFAAVVAIFLLIPPISQTSGYHDFADRRAFLGIANFMDVVSNLAFFLIGLGGIRLCLRQDTLPGRCSWLVFFLAFTCVAFGSARYHLAPDNMRLIWDRLPISLAFMGLFSAILDDSVLAVSERRILPWLIPLGPLSVIHWHLSGDLRFYIALQLVPILFTLYIAAASNLKTLQPRYLLAAAAAYVLAKMFESADTQIYSISGQLISGHTLKHLLAAASGFFLYCMLRKSTGIISTGALQSS